MGEYYVRFRVFQKGLLMKRKILFTAVLAAAAMTVASCSAYSESKTTANLSVTKDGETTKYDFESTLSAGDTDEMTIPDDTPDDKNDDKCIQWNVENDGIVYISAPSEDALWWEVVGNTDTVEVLDWEVEDGLYYAACGATVKEGESEIILAAYEDEDGDPIQYCIIPVRIAGGEFDGSADGVVVEDLDEYYEE